jgi:flagellar protein FliO/FliZ
MQIRFLVSLFFILISVLLCSDNLWAQAVEPAELATPAIPPSASVGAVATTQEKTATLPENEIPVQLESIKKPVAENSILFKAISSFAIIALLAAGAYLLIGKYRRSQVAKSSAPEIKILRQHYLGPKKSLAIIRVAGESLLIGVTDSNINMIKSLALLDEDVPEEAPQNFHSVFQQKNKLPIVPTSQQTSSHSSGGNLPQEQEDFSISGIRDFVSNRLKNMRSIE